MHRVRNLTTKRFFEFPRIFQFFIAYNNVPSFCYQLLVIQFDFILFKQLILELLDRNNIFNGMCMTSQCESNFHIIHCITVIL